MKIKLNKLILNNFKKVKELTVDFNGLNLNVYGDNGVGKTTLFDAYSWALFDKSSLGVSDFGIKPIGMERPQVSVEAHIDVDGRNIRLKKTLEESWTKKRGSETESFSGNATSYWINEIPKRATEYKAFIDTIITEESFKRLSDASYFLALKKPDMRRVLIDMVKGVSDRTVAGDDEQQLALVERMEDNGYTVDDLLKLVKQNVSIYNKEQEQINPRIDEINRTMPCEAVESVLSEGLSKGELFLSEISERILRASSSLTRASELSREIENVKSKISALKSNKIAEKNSAKPALFAEVSKWSLELSKVNGELDNQKQKKMYIQSNVEQCNVVLLDAKENYLKLKAKQKEVLSREFTPLTELVCPQCNQPIIDGLEKANRDAEDAFKLQKERVVNELQAEMDKIASRGSEAKARKTCYELELAETEKLIDGLEVQKETVASKSIIATNNYNSFVEVTEIDENLLNIDTEYVTLNSQLNKLIEEEAGIVKVDMKSLLEEKEKVQVQVARIKEMLREQEERAKQQKRIDELVARGRELAQMIASEKATQYQCERFIRAKAELLEDSINGLFENLKFRLFEVQINGGIADDCTPMINGVEYTGASNSERIRANLDIVNAMQRNADIYVPVFIDNAEACTTFRNMETQTIKLFVSENDKTLRIEKENN